jgi:hypothetical protein
VFFGQVLADGLSAHDGARTGHLHRPGNLSAAIDDAGTTMPVVAARGLRRPWRKTADAVLRHAALSGINPYPHPLCTGCVERHDWQQSVRQM